MPNELEVMYANCDNDCYHCDYVCDCSKGRDFLNCLTEEETD